MRSLLLGIALVACKDNPPKPPPAPVAPPAPGWVETCAAALRAKQTPVRRLTQIIEGCQPCGAWSTLLAWNTPPAEGGPAEAALEEAMAACNAYCSKDAKMHFLGALGDARGKATNRPWRLLGDKCGAAVSAVPDARYLSAPYFALDRIARAAAAEPRLAPLLAGIELPLPAVSASGVGFELPTAAVMKPEPGRHHVTVTAAELRVGVLPVATLGANGVNVPQVDYPGALVAPKDLAAQLDVLTGSPTGRVVVIAPVGLPATRVADVVAAAGRHEVVLAVAATGAPPGWTLPGIVPVVLDAQPDPKMDEYKLDAALGIATLAKRSFTHPRITLAKDATVAHLAALLGAFAFGDARQASFTKRP